MDSTSTAMPDTASEQKILVVEDEPTLAETLTYNLERQGYTVFTCGDGHDALRLAESEKPDLVVLDVMLPGIDGFEVCRLLRQGMNMPILMLTARSGEIDKIVGLEVGADDYLSKPFSMRELLARVKAHLRRVRLLRSLVRLKPMEFELLHFLALNQGIVLSREKILESVWGWDFNGGSRTVDVHIRWLREKIEPQPAEPTRIMTVRGIGYRFEG